MFYITSQLQLDPGLRQGSRVKAGQIVAFDPSFFGKHGSEVSYKAGLLVRTAIVSTDQTYEDSIMVSSSLIRDTVSYVTMVRDISLGPKANLQKIASVGDVVQPNTALAIFENVPEESGTSEILSRVGAEFNQLISELSTNVAQAKDAGEIVEVEAYYNRDLADLSPSLRKALKDLEERAKARIDAAKLVPGADPIRITTPRRVKGDKVLDKSIDGVLFRFYIRTKNEAGPGDKYTVQACKGIVSKVFESGEEPITPDQRPIDFVLSPLSTVSRMTNDIYMMLWTCSVLVRLKERVGEIFDE